jgi:hypothetical protein
MVFVDIGLQGIRFGWQYIGRFLSHNDAVALQVLNYAFFQSNLIMQNSRPDTFPLGSNTQAGVFTGHNKNDHLYGLDGSSMNISLSKVTLLVLSVYLSAGCAEKHELDRQMEELCKKDGGVKIYETVKLSPEMFDDLGNLKAIKPVRKNGAYVTQIADVYEQSSETVIIKDGDLQKREGRLTRNYTVLIHVTNKKKLAEKISYSRVGGDLFVLGHHTQAHCPKEPIDLIEKVFSK